MKAAATLRHIEQKRLFILKRRRDYLAQLISQSDDPLSWDKAEKAALDWAIRELEGNG